MPHPLPSGARQLGAAAGPLTIAVTGTDTAMADIVAAFAHVVAILRIRQTDGGHEATPIQPGMLTVSQTAALLGLSRTTLIRKANSGELPCIVITRGARQKMRRFPRALIEDLSQCGGHSTQADLKDCTARWLASRADHTTAGTPA